VTIPGRPARRGTPELLACGVAAGPIFMLVALLQAFTRAGFDVSVQPISFLSLGDLGWIQVTNFVFCGALLIACAVGIRRTLRTDTGGRWAPWFLGGVGLGLIIAGLFPPDPGFGFPPGTAEGAPSALTYRSQLHGVGFTLAFISFVVTCAVFARRDGRRRHWGRLAYSVLTAVGTLTLSMWPGNGGIALRDLAAAALLWAWITVQSVWLMARPAVPVRHP
jgi:hypothetical membrane protein